MSVGIGERVDRDRVHGRAPIDETYVLPIDAEQRGAAVATQQRQAQCTPIDPRLGHEAPGSPGQVLARCAPLRDDPHAVATGAVVRLDDPRSRERRQSLARGERGDGGNARPAQNAGGLPFARGEAHGVRVRAEQTLAECEGVTR